MFTNLVLSSLYCQLPFCVNFSCVVVQNCHQRKKYCWSAGERRTSVQFRPNEAIAFFVKLNYKKMWNGKAIATEFAESSIQEFSPAF